MKRQIERSRETHICKWVHFVDDWDYETGCSNYFEDLEQMDFKRCGFMYCPFCGRKITWEAVEGMFIQ
ncbi:MAG: hypothetical protein RLZZ419_267 [Pseudomonadota bacterium]|jgi:hypothetical protein